MADRTWLLRAEMSELDAVLDDIDDEDNGMRARVNTRRIAIMTEIRDLEGDSHRDHREERRPDG